jgi:molecular chaperone DnaK
MIFQTEKALKDLGDKVSKSEKEEAEELIADLKKELEGDDYEEIKSKTEKLQEKAMALATKVYENIQKEQAANNQDSESSNDDNVQEADYEEE